MGKKLSQLKRNEIRCLVVEDVVKNEIFKIKNKEEIQKALNTYSDMEITKVFNPSSEVSTQIYSLMDKHLENDKVTTEISGVDMLVKVIPMLTDIEVDLNEEEAKEYIADPHEVLEKVLDEVNEILLKLNLDWIENLKLIGKMPEDVLNALIEMKKQEEVDNGQERI